MRLHSSTSLTLLLATAALCGCRTHDHDDSYTASNGEHMSANPDDYPATPTTGEPRRSSEGPSTSTKDKYGTTYAERERMEHERIMRNATEANARTLDEAGVLGCLLAVDDFEVRAATEAERRALPQSVLDYAKMLHEQHDEHMSNTRDLGQRIDVTPSETGAVEKEKAAHAQELARLQALPDREFARAYVDAMVEGHQKVLDKIDQKLVPAAKHTELEEFLATTRTHIARHLEEGRKVQASLPK